MESNNFSYRFYREKDHRSPKYKQTWDENPFYKHASHKFELEVTYPGLVVGIGLLYMDHDETGVKSGISLDYNTGLPIIQGSSVKGRLRSICQALADGELDEPTSDLQETLTKQTGSWTKNNNWQTIEKVKDLIERNSEDQEEGSLLSEEDLKLVQVDSLRMRISNLLGTYYKESLSSFIKDTFDREKEGEKDIFFDALADTNEHVKEDFVTPHKNIFSEPKPIRFLRIAEPTKFRFCFQLTDFDFGVAQKLTADQKLLLFKQLLMDYGIGAKTNKGYGYLKE